MCIFMAIIGAFAGYVLGSLGEAAYWCVGVFAAGHGWSLTDDQNLALLTLSAIGLGLPGFCLGLLLDVQ